jgi:hypothetical protein
MQKNFDLKSELLALTMWLLFRKMEEKYLAKIITDVSEETYFKNKVPAFCPRSAVVCFLGFSE